MSHVFASAYADAYDALYSDKDYAAECELIERLFGTYGDSPVHSILDLGCGTGNHALPLAQRGYEVLGVDCSEGMLANAKRKAVALTAGSKIAFHQGDVRSICLSRRFDAALMMFAVLGYQLTNADVLAALKTARGHLNPGGLLIFDVWYGPAVLRQRPSQKVKTTSTDGGKILRFASGELDVSRHICSVYFHLWRLEGDRLLAETEETHPVRFFFPLELELFLESSAFAPVRLGALPKFDQDPDETTWNVLGVARAV